MPNSCQWMLLLAAPPALGGSEQSICCSRFALRPAPGGQKGKGRGKMSCSRSQQHGGATKLSVGFGARSCHGGSGAARSASMGPPVQPVRGPMQKQSSEALGPDRKGHQLGKLFYLQGVQWTSHGLYEFYKSCRVLASRQKFTVGALSKYTRRMQQQELQRPSLSPGHSHPVCGNRLHLVLDV